MSEYKTGQKNLDSYKTGIFISATTTMIGIGVLIFASHPALKSIGLITIIGMFCVIIISNTIQPALFKYFITNRTDKKRVPFTFLSLLQSVFAFIWFAVGCFRVRRHGQDLAGSPAAARQSVEPGKRRRAVQRRAEADLQ